MGIIIPLLNIKIPLESNPPKSRILASRLAVSHGIICHVRIIYIYIYIERERDMPMQYNNTIYICISVIIIISSSSSSSSTTTTTSIIIIISVCVGGSDASGWPTPTASPSGGAPRLVRGWVRPVHLLRVFLLRVLESNFPGDPLSNSTDMRIPTP